MEAGGNLPRRVNRAFHQAAMDICCIFLKVNRDEEINRFVIYDFAVSCCLFWRGLPL